MAFIFFDPYREDTEELYEFLLLYDAYCSDFNYAKSFKTFSDFLETNFENTRPELDH